MEQVTFTIGGLGPFNGELSEMTGAGQYQLSFEDLPLALEFFEKEPLLVVMREGQPDFETWVLRSSVRRSEDRENLTGNFQFDLG